MIETLSLISAWLAPTFVVASFLLKKINQVRTVNLIGCVFFVIYGITTGWLWPVIVPNGILALIQIYFLVFKREKPDTPATPA